MVYWCCAPIPALHAWELVHSMAIASSVRQQRRATEGEVAGAVVKVAVLADFQWCQAALPVSYPTIPSALPIFQKN